MNQCNPFEISISLYFGKTSRKLDEIRCVANDFRPDPQGSGIIYFCEITKHMPNESRLYSGAISTFFAVRNFMSTIHSVIEDEIKSAPGRKLWVCVDGEYMRIDHLSQLFLIDIPWPDGFA